MWMLANKQAVPDGMVVRHKCIGNRACINPDHLEIGTPRDNVQDAIRQGRFRIAVGTERPFSSLTAEQVRAIRSLRPSGLGRHETEWSYAKLGRHFGISIGIIWQVVNFKTYKTC